MSNQFDLLQVEANQIVNIFERKKVYGKLDQVGL